MQWHFLPLTPTFSLSLSLSLSLTPLSPALPLPPSVLIERIGPTWITVNWTEMEESFPPLSDYLVEYKLSFDSNWTQLEVPGQLVEANLTSLYPHANYDVRVRGDNLLGTGDPSPTLSAMTLPGALGSRVDPLTNSVQLDSNSSDSLTVTWTVPLVSHITC